MLLLDIDLMAVGLFPWLGLTGAPPWRLLLHILAITGGVGILLRCQGSRRDLAQSLLSSPESNPREAPMPPR
jgi:hypothetical protein